MGVCRDVAPEFALAAYARGSCTDETGQAKSKQRVDLARRLLSLRKLPPSPLAAENGS